ncbi:MAG: NAD-glutamate dehydrogenase, partial [Rhodomicrobium sp.]|nr:NAD-glutamate dehydrogenase [Rhodomicrobium sp.]
MGLTVGGLQLRDAGSDVRRIDALDGKITGASQLGLYVRVQQILNRNVAWFLRHDISAGGLTQTIARHKEGFASLKEKLGAVATPQTARRREPRARGTCFAALRSVKRRLAVAVWL